MKKLLGILCVSVAMLVMVSGCKDATTSVSNGSEMIMRIGDTTITKENINTLLKLHAGYNSVLQDVIQKILDEEITITKEIEQAAKESFETSKKNLGENFLRIIERNGYADEEDYYRSVSLNGVLRKELTKKYLVEENQIEKYHPFKAQMLITNNQVAANMALEELMNGIPFEEVIQHYGDISKSDGSIKVYYSESGLPAIVTEKVTNTAQAQLLEEVITDSVNSLYYIVNIVDYDYRNFIDEVVAAITEKVPSVNDEAIAFYLKKHKFRVYDVDIYNGIKQTNPTYLVQDK